MSVVVRVICYHDVLLNVCVLMYLVVCGKTDVLVLVDFLYRPIECFAQTVGSIASTLGKTNGCCATLDAGSINCQTFLIAVVVFGQDRKFVICAGNAVVKEQFVTIV